MAANYVSAPPPPTNVSPVSPISPSSPIVSQSRSQRPTFNRLRSSTRRIVPENELSYKEQLLRSADMVQRKAIKIFQKMTFFQRCLASFALVCATVVGILVLVYSRRIFDWLGPVAEKWRQLPAGWLILWFIIFVSAFPPIIGYSTALTVAGFVWGFPNGWFVAASANVAGSLASFITCKTILAGYVNRLVGEDKRFNALALVLKHDGLKILVMIRLCPLPYSISNGAMSTFPTVSPMSFALATALATPKLMIHVFIGGRLADIVENGGKMDTVTKMVNYASIFLGGLMGIGLGYYIYQRTVARAHQLELEEEAQLTGGSGGEGSDNDYFAGVTTRVAPTGMDDDDISLWDNNDGGYRDDFTDEEGPFAGGYADEEAAVGIKGSKGSPLHSRD